ncbi:hypothetical protein [Sinorhizobium meliloti]|uniref:Uncharacterized protein n=1 Tax=Rhizobium meliloti TaxID=382 RepID=A0A2J0YTI1_RHIML|nr:hypothetical protein [Sinorhizobium meliloti]PJR09287.1 hypothetical protein CEJ86_31360 [Sinorhizobium meliloti]
MDDREARNAGDAERAPDLSEVAAQCAAADLLDFAAQLAGLADDLKALAARPIEPVPIMAEPDHSPEAISPDP